MYQGRAANSPVRDSWRRSPERVWPGVRNAPISSGQHLASSSQSKPQKSDVPLFYDRQYELKQLCVHYCQVFGRKITADTPIPCLFYNLNCCWPCWMEKEIRELPESEQISYRFDLLFNQFFRDPEPKEFKVSDNFYQDYFVHKIPMARYNLVKRNIEKRDFSDVTGEELMVYMYMKGEKVGDSLVRFAHPVNNGSVIQYHWRQLRTDAVTLRILQNAYRLIKTIPGVLRSRSRLELVLNQVLVSLAENGRPAYLKYNQFKSIFLYENFTVKKANQYICKWRMEQEDVKWERTPKEEEVDNLISEVLEKSTSGFHLSDQKFEHHRRLILEKVYNAIVQNNHEAVLNPLQIRKLSGVLGDTMSGIRTMFEQICVENSTLSDILDNTGTIMRGILTGIWPGNFETTFLEKQFENILKSGVTLEEDHFRKIAFFPELPLGTVMLAFEEFKAKLERDQADDDVPEPDECDEESDGTSDRPRPSIFAPPCPLSPRYQGGRSPEEKLELEFKYYQDFNAYSAQVDKEGESDIDLTEDSDGAVDEHREQEKPWQQDESIEQRKYEAPCSSGQYSASFTQFDPIANFANKRPGIPTTLVVDKVKKPRLDGESPPLQSSSEKSGDSNTPDDNAEYDADSESDEDEPVQGGEDDEVPMETGEQHLMEEHPIHDEPENDSDGNSDDDEQDPQTGNEQVSIGIDQQLQVDIHSEHDNLEHDDDNVLNEDDPEMPARIQRIGVPMEVEQPPPDGNQDFDYQEDHEENGRVSEGVPMMLPQIDDDDPRGDAQNQPNEESIADDRDVLQENGKNPVLHQQEGEPVIGFPDVAVPVGGVQARLDEDLANDEQDDLQGNSGNPDPQPQAPMMLSRTPDEDAPRAVAQPQPERDFYADDPDDLEEIPEPQLQEEDLVLPVLSDDEEIEEMSDDEQDDIQENDGNPDPQPQLLQLQADVDRPRGGNAADQRGQIQHAPVVNRAVLTPRPVRRRAGQPLPVNQPRRVSARIRKATRQISQNQAANRPTNRVLRPRALPRQSAPAVIRPQRVRGRNAQPAQPRVVRNQYRPWQILNQAQVNQFTCEIRIKLMSQAEVQAVLQGSRNGNQAPYQPRNRSQRAQARAQRAAEPQVLRRSERLRSMHAN